jgi:hypothetical protein
MGIKMFPKRKAQGRDEHRKRMGAMEGNYGHIRFISRKSWLFLGLGLVSPE